jgi:hypothetical protein
VGTGASQTEPGRGDYSVFSKAVASSGNNGDGGKGPTYNSGTRRRGYYGGGGGAGFAGGGRDSSWVMPTGSAGISYSVATAAGAGSVTITPIAPLPVQLTIFTAEAVGSAARLTWRTASELNNARFEVEASTDGRTFAHLGNVAGHGTIQLAQ